MKFRAAAVCWKLRQVSSADDYFDHLESLVLKCMGKGAEIIVLPELHVLELLALHPHRSEQESPSILAPYAETIESILAQLSSTTGATIIGGSHFRSTEHGIENACAISSKRLPLAIASKNVLTGYEKDIWSLSPGRGLIQSGNVGITICYDCEFPEAIRALAETGTKILAVPSWTESEYGFQRVRWSCMARAIENQIFVIQSSLVGGFGREPVMTAFGSAAIITPSAAPFELSEIITESAPNEEGVVIADLDLHKLVECRAGGEVANWIDRSSGHWVVTHMP